MLGVERHNQLENATRRQQQRLDPRHDASTPHTSLATLQRVVRCAHVLAVVRIREETHAADAQRNGECTCDTEDFVVDLVPVEWNTEKEDATGKRHAKRLH